MNKAPGQPLGGLFFGGHPFIVISDNYLSATVVSYQKKDCGSHFVSCRLHVILSLPTSAATAVATTAYRFLSTFLFLLSQFFLLRSSTYPQPRLLMAYAHPEPLGRVPGSPLPPVLLDTG